MYYTINYLNSHDILLQTSQFNSTMMKKRKSKENEKWKKKKSLTKNTKQLNNHKYYDIRTFDLSSHDCFVNKGESICTKSKMSEWRFNTA